MRRTVFHAAAFAPALCALAAAPSRAAAQGAGPAPFPRLYVDSFRNLTRRLFECQAAQSGAARACTPEAAGELKRRSAAITL